MTLEGLACITKALGIRHTPCDQRWILVKLVVTYKYILSDDNVHFYV
jgi:hypothetical protein